MYAASLFKKPKLARGFFDFVSFLKTYACLDDEWSPQLYSWQQEGANVLFFTFINPDSMIVPNSFVNLAASRGTNAEGAVPQDTMIIFAIGGIQYSTDYNPWHWLTSKEAAEAMAIEVATWPDKYVISCNMLKLRLLKFH